MEYVEISSKLAQEGEDVIVVEQVPKATPELVVETTDPEEQQGSWAVTHGTFDRTMMYTRTRPRAMRAQFS